MTVVRFGIVLEQQIKFEKAPSLRKSPKIDTGKIFSTNRYFGVDLWKFSVFLFTTIK